MDFAVLVSIYNKKYINQKYWFVIINYIKNLKINEAIEISTKSLFAI